MNFGQKNGLRTWIEINKKALKHNYQTLRQSIPSDCLLMSVVKSNAYGHGLLDFSKEISALGANWLGVDSVVEAIALRKSGIKKPILVLGFTLPIMMKEAIRKGISLTISSFESLKELQKIHTNKIIKIHIKVDTGMHRQGFLIGDLSKLLDELRIKNPHIGRAQSGFRQKSKVIVEGLYTHFASVGNTDFPDHTNNQIREFKIWKDALESNGFQAICHTSGSAGALFLSDSHFDMVRVGISMYGLWPSKEVKIALQNKISLKPVLSWKTLIAEIKTIQSGSKVGYDFTEIVSKATTIANCPIGYWHGFPRALSSVGYVLLKGKRCKVLGRVSMDMITIDVTGVSGIKVGDEVAIIGKQGKDEIIVDDLANLSNSVNYEIMTRINPLIKRIYI